MIESLFWNITSINPLYVAFIIDISAFGVLFNGVSGKSSLYAPLTLCWSASLIGVLGGTNEIPLKVARAVLLIVTNGSLFNKYV